MYAIYGPPLFGGGGVCKLRPISYFFELMGWTPRNGELMPSEKPDTDTPQEKNRREKVPAPEWEWMKKRL